MEQEKKELLAYLMPRKTGSYLSSVLYIAFGLLLAAGALTFLFEDGVTGPGILLAVAAVLVGGMGVLSLHFKRQEVRETRAWVASLESGGGLLATAQDFRAAEQTLYDAMRFGREQIYVEHRPHPIPYTDIARVYQMIVRSELVETDRFIVAVLNDEKQTKVKLGDVRSGGLDDEMVEKLMLTFLQKNPDIQLGEESE